MESGVADPDLAKHEHSASVGRPFFNLGITSSIGLITARVVS